MYRELKYWWPVYVWIVRKRVDKAYQARLIAWEATLDEIDLKLADGRLGAEKRKQLEAEKKDIKRRKPGHFDHIEACAGYHIIKVSRVGRPRRLQAVTRPF